MFPGKFESSNLSRDNLIREIGRTPLPTPSPSLHQRLAAPAVRLRPVYVQNSFVFSPNGFR